MEFTEGRTPYDILELTNGPQATDAEIRKAYKVLALRKHPDKNKDNPTAADEFQELEKAYRVLTDASARGALDDYLNAKALRHQRQSQESDKRRKMREELEKREREATQGRSEEHIARQRLQQELERLRKKAEEEQRAMAQAQAQAAAAAAAQSSGAGHTSEASDETKAQLRCTLKVTWNPNSRDYQPQELRQIFASHGTVCDVVVREPKRRSGGKVSKATALVVMGSAQEADRAANAVNGDVDDPLLVVPLLKLAPGLAPDNEPATTINTTNGTTNGHRTSASPPPPTFPLYPPTTSPPHQPTQPPTHATRGLFPVAGGGSASTSPGPQGQGIAAAATGPAKPLFAAGAGVQGAGIPAPAFGISTTNTNGVNGSNSNNNASANGSGTQYSTSGFASFSFPGAGSGGGGFGGVGMSSAEDAILQKMRRAAERERQLAAARAEDEAGQ